MTTPPVEPPVVPPAMPTVVSSAMTAWVKEVGTDMIAEALRQLLADEPELIAKVMTSPITAWLNGWMTQLRTDYSPGGVLEQTLKNAAHDVKVFLPNPEGVADE